MATPEPDPTRTTRARVDYPVYAPTTTLRLPRTSFERVSCGNARDDFLSVDYGRQATLTSRWIGLQESPGPIGCVDGPDGFGPAATFTVNGAKAYVSGSCAGGRSTCSTSSPALAAKQAYTTITLPGSAAHPTPTFIEVYTQAMTLTQITAFVRGLVPVA
jgi:hypothetical protein